MAYVFSGEIARDLSKYYEAVLSTDLSSVEQALSYAPEGSPPIDSIIYAGIAYLHLESVLGFLENPEKIHELNFGQGSALDHYVDRIAEFCKENGFGDVSPLQRVCINTACTSGGQAIGIAFENIRSGKWKRCLVVGSDWRPLETGIMGFHVLKAISISKDPPASVCRPFDATRSGVVRGQCGGALVIEALAEGTKSSRRGFAEVSGYGCTTDAYRLTDGREDALCLKEAMTQAISSAGLSHLDIDYVNAHGTSTRLNDRIETKAIKEVFGERAYRIPVSSLKSQIGHTIAGAGMIESIASIIMLQHQKLAPTINYRVFDPDCDLDYVPNHSRDFEFRHVLKNSLAFGGHNVSLIFSKIEDESHY